MDVKEFKAWFTGFCDNIAEAPTKEQFEKIKAKVQEIEIGPKIAYRGLEKGRPELDKRQRRQRFDTVELDPQ